MAGSTSRPLAARLSTGRGRTFFGRVVGEGAFFGKNCPFPHAPIPEKTFALVMSPVPVAVWRAEMELRSRQGHGGDKRERERERWKAAPHGAASFVMGAGIRHVRRERAGSDGEGPLSGMGEAETVQRLGTCGRLYSKGGLPPRARGMKKGRPGAPFCCFVGESYFFSSSSMACRISGEIFGSLRPASQWARPLSFCCRK